MQETESPMRLVDHFCWLAFSFTSLSGSMRTLYALCNYSTLLRQSVLLFMRTIFNSLIINHPFAHSLCSSPFSGDPRTRTAFSGPLF